MNAHILSEVNKLIHNEYLNETYLEGVTLYQISNFIERVPLTYDLCCIILLQGSKTIYLPEHTLSYDKETYLVVPITLPVECETFATPEEPVIALSIDLDKKKMQDILSSLSQEERQHSNKTSLGIFQGKVTDTIQDIIYRLLKILQSKEESAILGEMLLKEFYYRIATSENAHFLHKMFQTQEEEAKIAKSLKKIHAHYNENLEVTTLAKAESMSLSSFHRHFKEVTSYTPLQYIKRLRLNKAKELIAVGGLQVNETAYEIGYLSVSQFSRDFKNYFGFPPKEAR